MQLHLVFWIVRVWRISLYIWCFIGKTNERGKCFFWRLLHPLYVFGLLLEECRSKTVFTFFNRCFLLLLLSCFLPLSIICPLVFLLCYFFSICFDQFFWFLHAFVKMAMYVFVIMEDRQFLNMMNLVEIYKDKTLVGKRIASVLEGRFDKRIVFFFSEPHIYCHGDEVFRETLCKLRWRRSGGTGVFLASQRRHGGASWQVHNIEHVWYVFTAPENYKWIYSREVIIWSFFVSRHAYMVWRVVEFQRSECTLRLEPTFAGGMRGFAFTECYGTNISDHSYFGWSPTPSCLSFALLTLYE